MILWPILLWAAFCFVVGWEIMALMNDEDRMPTWSRMIWILQKKYPWFRYVVSILVVLIVFGFGAWLLIHFWIGLPELRG